VVCTRPAPDNYHVSKLINVSVATVLIDENHASVPMMIVPCDVIFIVMTTRVRSRTSQHDRSDCQGGRY
jgi:hypothetical protein